MDDVSGNRCQSGARLDLNAFQFTVLAGTVRWLTGQQGDPGDDTRNTAFQMRQQALTAGETLARLAQRAGHRSKPFRGSLLTVSRTSFSEA